MKFQSNRLPWRLKKSLKSFKLMKRSIMNQQKNGKLYNLPERRLMNQFNNKKKWLNYINSLLLNLKLRNLQLSQHMKSQLTNRSLSLSKKSKLTKK